MQKPLVTVAIPTFNRPSGLQRTLKQITGQTYQNIEIVVADNCSAGDETQSVLNNFIATDNRIITYRHDENIGAFDNFKFLLTKASGEYFMWAADDDEWSTDFISLCMEHFSDNVASVMGGVQVVVRGTGQSFKFPILDISAEKTNFENAMTYLNNNMQAQLFYGVHKKRTIEWILNEQPYDFFDCYFVLKQIIQHGYRIVPEYIFTTGVDGNACEAKPFNKTQGRVYTYYPFYKICSDLITNAITLTNEEKSRLLLTLTQITIRYFRSIEKELQKELVGQPYDILQQYLLDEKI